MLATIAKVVDGVAHAVRDVVIGEKVLRQIVDEALGHIESGLEPVSYTHLDVYKRQL